VESFFKMFGSQTDIGYFRGWAMDRDQHLPGPRTEMRMLVAELYPATSGRKRRTPFSIVGSESLDPRPGTSFEPAAIAGNGGGGGFGVSWWWGGVVIMNIFMLGGGERAHATEIWDSEIGGGEEAGTS